jgi:hypothetical protein
MKPNLKYDHAFAIVRVDGNIDNREEPSNLIVVKKVVWSEEAAESEVARLNRLNADKGCVYFWTITRVERVS